MKSDLAKKLRRLFEQRLISSCSGFLPDKNAEAPPGYRVYRRQMDEALTAFIVLEPSPKAQDRFTVSIGWSRNGDFPSRVIAFGPDDPPVNGALRFRLSAVCGPTPDVDFWWRVRLNDSGTTPLAEIPPGFPMPLDMAVEDAIGKITEYAIPYFQTLKKI